MNETKATKKTRRTVQTKSTTKKSSKTTKTITKNLTKQIKKAPLWILVVILLFALGGAGGYFGYSFLCKDDMFEMVSYSNGENDISIGQEEDTQVYIEKGARCIVLGKDISSQIKITYKYREDITHDAVEVDDIDETVAGTYYAIYTIDNIKYKSVTLIRNIFVMREE